MQVYALTGGLPPIMPTFDPVSIKKRTLPTKKVNTNCPLRLGRFKIATLIFWDRTQNNEFVIAETFNLILDL